MLEEGQQEETLIYAINSCGNTDTTTTTTVNPNWVSPHLQSSEGTQSCNTNGDSPDNSIGLLVCVVGDLDRQDVYKQCIEETFR